MDKGKRIIKRALPRLSEEQRTAIFTALVRILDRLDVVTVPIQAQVALFMDAVMAPIGALLSRLPFAILPRSLNVMLDTMPLFGVFNMARSKVGVAFLQQFLLRAEELKQQGGATPAELADWCGSRETSTAPNAGKAQKQRAC